MNELDRRIRDAKKALESYPDWVRENAYFQGGENLRNEHGNASKQPNLQQNDRRRC